MPWSARRRSSSRARKAGSSGTSMKRFGVSIGRPRRLENATPAATTSTSTDSMRFRMRGCASPASRKRKMAASARPEPARFWAVVIAVIVADVITKLIAVRTLVPIRAPREVIGEWLRWTLVYNPGAAFGLHLGPYSRWIFMVLTVVALVILWKLYGQTREGDTM